MMAENNKVSSPSQMQGLLSKLMTKASPKQIVDLLNKLQSEDCETGHKQSEATSSQQSAVKPNVTEKDVPTPSRKVGSNLITSAKDWVPPRYVVNPEEDKRVLTMRTEELVGKTIIGTFFMKDQEPYVKHWIRWNEKKADNIFVPKELAHKIFDGQPKSGAKVSTSITAVGPATVSAWQMHPQCESFSIIRMPLYGTDYSKKAAETLKARREELLGKTVTGTFFQRTVDSQLKCYIRWNDKRSDNVLVHEDAVSAAFRGNPVSGAKVCATITRLGPKGVSPWRMNPMCEKITVVKRWSPKPCRNLPESMAVATEGGARMTNSRWARHPTEQSIAPLSHRIAGSESIWTTNGGLSFTGYQRRRNRWAQENTPSSGAPSSQTPPLTNKVYSRVTGRATTVTLGSAFAKRAVLEL
jgi:hypothetical protein